MKKLQKYLLFALALSLLFAALLLPAHATEDSPAGYIEWEISENGDTLSGNGKEYSYVKVNYKNNIKIQPWIYDTYGFVNSVSFDDKMYRVQSTHKDAEIVMLYHYDAFMIYATQEGERLVADLVDGSPAQYVLCERFTQTKNKTLTPQDVAVLQKEVTVPKVAYDVQELDRLDSYTLFATDESGTVCYITGRFYKFSDNKYGYVDHLSLDNTHFDANGSFSYRSGTVEVTMLSGEGVEALQGAIDGLRVNAQEFSSEYDEYDDRFFSDTAYSGGMRVLFWGMFVLLGFALPLLPILFGLLKGLPQKRGTRYWLILAAVGFAWLLFSIILTPLLLALGA